MTILVVGIFLILYGVYSKKYSVWVGMLFVLLIMGFQENIPGDYMSYKYTFEHGDANVLGSTTKESEFFYLWIISTMPKFLTFHWYVLLISTVQCLAMGLMIKEFAVKHYHYFGVLLIFFTFYIMLIQMKAMRQGYGVDMLLLAYYLLGKRKYLLSFVPAIITFGFHNTSIVALPFFVVLWLMMFLHRKDKRAIEPIGYNKQNGIATAAWVAGGLFVFYLLKFVFFANYINPFLQGLEVFEYADYLDVIDERAISWWILFYHIITVFAVTLYYVNEKDFFRRYLAMLTIVAMFLGIGTFGFGNLMRMSAYFIIFSIVVFPNVAGMLKQLYGKQVALAFVLFNMLYVMYGSVGKMISMDFSSGTGFGSFAFSFLNW